MTTLCSRARGFGYLDVVVAIAVILIALAFLLPTSVRSRPGSNRVKCASNLRQIGQAFLLYSNENRQAYPRIRSVEDAPIAYYTGVGDANPFDGVNDPAPNDVTAALYLLVRTQDIGTEVFTCPSDKAEKYSPAEGTLKHGNFPGRGNLSYAIAVPYVPKAAVEKGYRWNANQDPEFAFAADMGPGGNAAQLTTKSPMSDVKLFNSRNHDQEGQNVLFGDGHVEFANTPFVGFKKDFIYGPSTVDPDVTVLPPGTVPQHANDSILLPTDRE